MESPACSKEQPALNSLRWIHYMGVISKRTQWFPEPSYCCSLQKSCWKPSQQAKWFLRGGNPLSRLSTVITLFKVFQSHTTICGLTIAVMFEFITKSPPNVRWLKTFCLWFLVLLFWTTWYQNSKTILSYVSQPFFIMTFSPSQSILIIPSPNKRRIQSITQPSTLYSVLVCWSRSCSVLTYPCWAILVSFLLMGTSLFPDVCRVSLTS